MLSLALVSVGLAGCSTSFPFGTSPGDGYLAAGEELIEGELADQIGLGPLDATCSGQDLTAGDTFQCAATPGQLTPIRFTGTVNPDADGVFITSSNLLLAEQVEEVEAFAAGLIESQTDQVIGADDFECSDTSVIISPGEVLDCFVTVPRTGTVYDAPVTVDNLDELSITVSVGDPVE
jgi:hypothetical protein